MMKRNFSGVIDDNSSTILTFLVKHAGHKFLAGYSNSLLCIWSDTFNHALLTACGAIIVLSNVSESSSHMKPERNSCIQKKL